MFCYYCGATLDGTDSCPSCEVDVRMIKKIQGVSNYWYNEGLARVKVRDLSGGADALKKSLKWNKMNIDDRHDHGIVNKTTWTNNQIVAAFIGNDLIIIVLAAFMLTMGL